MKKAKLIPPDKKHCQAMVVRGGCYPDAEHFMMLGGHGELVQCNKRPVVIAYENKISREDGQKGSMSLCQECLDKFKRTMPRNFATMRPIAARKKITK